jgi:hypothetical protein
MGVASKLGQCGDFAKQIALLLWIVSKCRFRKFAAGLATRLPNCKGAG